MTKFITSLFILLAVSINLSSYAASETSGSRLPSVLSAMARHYSEATIDASTAPYLFQKLRDDSDRLISLGSVLDSKETEDPATHPLSSGPYGTWSQSVTNLTVKLNQSIQSVPNPTEESVSKTIAWGISQFPEHLTDPHPGFLNGILISIRPKLHRTEIDLWTLVWQLHSDATCNPLLVKDTTTGKTDYVATLNTNVIPVFAAYLGSIG